MVVLVESSIAGFGKKVVEGVLGGEQVWREWEGGESGESWRVARAGEWREWGSGESGGR